MTEPPETTPKPTPANEHQQAALRHGRDEWDLQGPPQPQSTASTRPARGPFTWRMPAAIIILALVVAPGALAILAARTRNANIVGTGLVLWAVLAGLGLVVFLAMVYVVSYVASAAWHDAQNARRFGDR